MKIFKILVSETAQKALAELDVKTSTKIKSVLKELSLDPFRSRSGVDIKKLHGCKEVMYRLRVGDFRAIYFIEENNVKVTDIIPREKGYDWLN
ncbi:MAG: type II toxin-antitoxin system RelE/ParE family toxin [Candidatus Aenigmatarchaeota archaeon]